MLILYSPIGELFRARIRQFPALVNLCTIDWFDPWPDSALQVINRKNKKQLHIPNRILQILKGNHANLKNYMLPEEQPPINNLYFTLPLLIQSVALHFLQNITDEAITNSVLNSIVRTCQFMHSSVIKASEDFLQVRDILLYS